MGNSKQSIEEAGKEYMDNHWILLTDFEKYAVRESYEMGIKSDAAKEYWFEQFKAQKPITDEEIMAMAEKEYPIIETIKGSRVAGHILGYQQAMRNGFIKGFKSALNK